MKINDNISIYNKDCIELMATMSDESIDVICIDPPYLYLKNQKLERPFDEQLFFSECKRLLAKDGFIIMFGRGTSFYRWNTILDHLGFTFKEEIVWDKSYGTSPVHTINRVHETVSIFAKGNAVLRHVKIPYQEARTEKDLDKVINDVNRLKTVFNNEKSFNYVLDYLNGERSDMKEMRSTNYATSCQTKAHGSQTVSPMVAIKEGMKIKSIISIRRDHYNTIHPTQKPVRLIERLLTLVIPVKKKRIIKIADFFGGSFSCMEAVIMLQRAFPQNEFFGIATEIDKEYFELGKERLEKLLPAQGELFKVA